MAMLLGHLGHQKTMTQMTQDLPACMAMQFKSMTQMTQMTQGPPAMLAWPCWRGHAGASMQHARAGLVAAGWPALAGMAAGIRPGGPGRAGGKGPSETYGSRTIFFLIANSPLWLNFFSCRIKRRAKSMESKCSTRFHLHRARSKRQSRA
jgi:hypothetical protein